MWVSERREGQYTTTKVKINLSLYTSVCKALRVFLKSIILISFIENRTDSYLKQVKRFKQHTVTHLFNNNQNMLLYIWTSL